MLLQRKYISENPFSDFQSRKVAPKVRRNFTPEERKVVAFYIRENDRWLYYGLLLQYYCFIRPVELRRLKFRNFNLVQETIHMNESQTKNHKAQTVTIPRVIIKDFIDPFFSSHALNLFVFGEGLQPHPSRSCSKNFMNRRHREILEQLKKEGQLKDISGFSWYSWKDTGATDLAWKIPQRDLQNQMSHSSLKMTKKYIHNSEVIESIRDLPERLV